MVSSTQRKLKKGLLAPKVQKVPTPLNAIAIERECDPIIDVQCNGLLIHKVLLDGRARFNVMKILAMRYLGLIIDGLALITLKMANKQIFRP
jgi:hypothetical protein